MTVEELIFELKKFPKKMEVVDYTGDTFDKLHYKRVYDSVYPHEEIEHLAVCIDFENNYRDLDISELKDIIKCQIYEYPTMYSGKYKEMIDRILNFDTIRDSEKVNTKWQYWGENKLNKPVFKLVGYEYKLSPSEIYRDYINNGNIQ